MSMSDLEPYRSPVSKLLPFFRKSRNKWKTKCKAAKRENKSLKTRLAKMKESRDRWKAKAHALKEGHSAESVPVGDNSKRELLQCVGSRDGGGA